MNKRYGISINLDGRSRALDAVYHEDIFEAHLPSNHFAKCVEGMSTARQYMSDNQMTIGVYKDDDMTKHNA